VVTRHDLLNALQGLRNGDGRDTRLRELLSRPAVVTYPEEPLRIVVNRMAATGITRFPVVKPEGDQELLGLISLQDLLKAREFSILQEHHRERVLRLRVPPSLRWRRVEEKNGRVG
jgi:chloride channel protein, CIC family